MNAMHTPGNTNLHTHGLHVDSDTPQDDVFVTVVGMYNLNAVDP
jgi:hypothetical protein